VTVSVKELISSTKSTGVVVPVSTLARRSVRLKPGASTVTWYSPGTSDRAM
jgi:hypothetical protein